MKRYAVLSGIAGMIILSAGPHALAAGAGEGPEETVQLNSEDNLKILDSLKNENRVLREQLKISDEAIGQKEREITELKKRMDALRSSEMKCLEERNDTLQRKLISMASNFLYIPYEDYSINKIAIPAFNFTKGNALFDQYHDRLVLLENYRDDIQGMIEFIASAEEGMSIPLDAYRKQEGAKALKQMERLPFYTRYSGYEDWRNTYLGQNIVEIQKELKAPSEKSIGNLQRIRMKLDALLK